MRDVQTFLHPLTCNLLMMFLCIICAKKQEKQSYRTLRTIIMENDEVQVRIATSGLNDPVCDSSAEQTFICQDDAYEADPKTYLLQNLSR